MNENFTCWEAAKHQQTPEDARLHLDTYAEEDPDNGSLIRAALNAIARSGNTSWLARDVKMSREGSERHSRRMAIPALPRSWGLPGRGERN